MKKISVLNSDKSRLKQTFKNKLNKLLNKDELGSFILVLANSMQDAQLQNALSSNINSTFKEIIDNHELVSAPDDQAILDKLKSTGISQYTNWKYTDKENWQCLLNPFRTLRPERSSNEVFSSLYKDFNDNAFHFSKPFLRPEIISNETFENTDLQIMYQKFPFAPFHLLIVIQADQNLPQFLNEEIHSITWKLSKHLENNIKGFTLAYNSLGAGASVNQLHIHGCINQRPLTIENPCWKHNNGTKNYPLKLKRFSSAAESWHMIEQLHKNNQPYNLLYSHGFCYVTPRMPQGSMPLPSWLSSIGWYEACGGFNLSHQSELESLTSTNIYSALATYSI